MAQPHLALQMMGSCLKSDGTETVRLRVQLLQFLAVSVTICGTGCRVRQLRRSSCSCYWEPSAHPQR